MQGPQRVMEVVSLPAAQQGQAVEVLTRAFMEDPEYLVLFPDAAERARSLAALWRGLLAYGLRYGLVLTTLAVEGVAIWLPPGQAEVTLWRTLRTGLALPRAVLGFSPQVRKRFLAEASLVEGMRRRVAPARYRYLWVLGVDPAHQGRGIGAGLLAPVLCRADAEGQPCYLEALTERNVAFYQKRGFRVVDEVKLFEGTVTIRAMLREPRLEA